MRRQLTFLVLAVSAAALAALMVNGALRQREAELVRAKAQSVEIVVAARDLPLGSRIDQGSIKLARWSREALPPEAIEDVQSVMNGYVRRALVTNEPVTAEALFNGDKSAGVMPLVIPPGMRAMSVQVDEVSDIAGFVLPHARVDVLAALSGSDNGQKPISKIVLENVEVLAVAQEMEKEKDQPELVKVVTLLVKPDEAELLALAGREGVLRLAMRNYNDQKLVPTAGADLGHLLSAYSPAAPPAPRKVKAAAVRPLPAPITVEIMRDGKTMHPAAFVNQASVAHFASEQAGQWSPIKDEAPSGTVRGANSTLAQQSNKTTAVSSEASAGPQAVSPAVGPQASSPQASSRTSSRETTAGPDEKTLDVDS
jgi:pilus assembly protein CpaB